MNNTLYIFRTAALAGILLVTSCTKFERHNQKPELESLQQGLRTSAAIGYCASVVTSASKGMALPDNVAYDKSSGLIYIDIDAAHPLPFNKSIGDIVIAFHWGLNGGVMSVLFANIDILGGTTRLYGLYAVPLIERVYEKDIRAIVVKQDIILGSGSDTILDLSNITNTLFNSKLELLETEDPSDTFVAVKQNFWIINVKQNTTPSDIYDDDFIINGGGQIAEVKGESGGVVYHAMIDTKINYSVCPLNPVEGYALSQNFKAGGEPLVDLGNSLLNFRNSCDGKAHVVISTGKYLTYSNKDIELELN